MKHITNIHINTQLYDKITKFYFNAKLRKYKHSYGWDEVFKDIQLSSQDKNLIPTNKTKQDWLSIGYNVARNKRGWAFAYIVKDDTMYIYDAENCRNLTVDYQNNATFTIFNQGEKQQDNIPMGYKISARRLDDGYIYLYKNGQQLPNYRFNEIRKIFHKYKNGEVYAIGLYGGKQFKITLDGIACALAESKITNIVKETVRKTLYESVKNVHQVKTLGEWECIDGQWWDGTPCGLEHKGLVQDVRMYDKQTNNDTFETIALFRRCDNGKFFYAQIIPIENSKETKWEPLPLNKIPKIIKRDIRNINLQEHKPYLPV